MRIRIQEAWAQVSPSQHRYIHFAEHQTQNQINLQ